MFDANRFWAKVAPADARGCRLWMGARKPRGYGVVVVDGKQVGAHRVAWRLAHGTLADDVIVCHARGEPACEPACVAVGHLYVGEPVRRRDLAGLPPQ